MRCPPVLLALALLGLGGCGVLPPVGGPPTAAPAPVPATPPATPPATDPAPAPTTAPAPTKSSAAPPAPPNDSAPPPPTAPVPCPGAGAVHSATWTQAEGGRSLAVTPAESLRACAGPLARWDGIPPGWAEVLDLAGPEADSPAMRQQYACHLRFARAKDAWNLEPWRPEVSEEDLLLARCNP